MNSIREINWTGIKLWYKESSSEHTIVFNKNLFFFFIYLLIFTVSSRIENFQQIKIFDNKFFKQFIEYLSFIFWKNIYRSSTKRMLY